MWFQGFLRSRAFTHTSDPICLEKWHFSDKLTSVGGMIKNLEKYFHEKSFSFVSLKLYHHPKTTLGNTGFSTKLQKQVQILGEISLFPIWGAIYPYVRPKIWQIRSKTSHSDIWDARRLAISEKVIFLYARLLYHCTSNSMNQSGSAGWHPWTLRPCLWAPRRSSSSTGASLVLNINLAFNFFGALGIYAIETIYAY